VVAQLHGDALNGRDLDRQRRGYYEELDVSGMANWRWNDPEEPEGWSKGRKVFFRERSDFLLRDLLPSVSTVLGGATCTSNSLGMRDSEYEKIKPANTYRMVLLGASHDMGMGVKDGQAYESLVEDHLNSRLPDARYLRYQILNLSVPGDSIVQRVLRLELKGFEFQPDAAILSVNEVDTRFIASYLRQVLIKGVEPSPGYQDVIQSVFHRAHVDRKMPAVMIERRLQPYVTELSAWSFQRFAQQCAQRGVRPLVLYRPTPADFSGVESSTRNETLGWARAAGLEVIDLTSAFDSVADRRSLVLAKWDDHTTALGHRLLADKLYEGLVPLLFGLPGKQQTSHLQKP